MAEATCGTNSHIETDSAEECPQYTCSYDDPLADNDDDFRQFIAFMPPRLQEENFDGLVIYSPEDKKFAHQFANHLRRIQFTYAKRPMYPTVILLNDIRGNGHDTLENLVERTTFIFLFCTRSFCEEAWSEILSNACLMKAIHDDSKRWFVVPVLTQPKAQSDYLPLLLNAIKPINYFADDADEFYTDTLEMMFSKKAVHRFQKDLELDYKRQRYYHENKKHLKSMKMASSRIQVNSGMSRGTRDLRSSHIQVMTDVEHQIRLSSEFSLCSLSLNEGNSNSSNQSHENRNSSSDQSIKSWYSSDTDSCLGQPGTDVGRDTQNSRRSHVQAMSEIEHQIRLSPDFSPCALSSNESYSNPSNQSHEIWKSSSDQPIKSWDSSYTDSCLGQLGAAVDRGTQNTSSHVQVKSSIGHQPYSSIEIKSPPEFPQCSLGVNESNSNSSIKSHKFLNSSSDQSMKTWNSLDSDSTLGQVASLLGTKSLMESSYVSTSCLSTNDSQSNSPLLQGRYVMENTNPSDSNVPQNDACNEEKSVQTEASTIIHIHISKADNVIVGDQGKISIRNECEREDTEDGSSSSDDDSDDISRQPVVEVETTGQTQPAPYSNDGFVPTEDNIREALPDLMHPFSQSIRTEDEEENFSIHLFCDPNDTVVKYRANSK